jgi:hypothetical protein
MVEIREYEVSESGHIYWAVRDRLGRFASRAVLEARIRLAQGAARRERILAAGRAKRAEALAAYRTYLDARREQADEATRGHLLRDWSKGSVTALFRPAASLRHASDELAEWFESNGSTLSFREFYAQAA